MLRDTGLRILADAAFIEQQMLLNLLTNALRPQTSPQLRLLACQSDSHHVAVEAASNGTDVPAALLEEIFVPLSIIKSAGSGLSLSRRIMQLHRGSLQVQSAHG